jgi:uncharacterized protein YxeA
MKHYHKKAYNVAQENSAVKLSLLPYFLKQEYLLLLHTTKKIKSVGKYIKPTTIAYEASID